MISAALELLELASAVTRCSPICAPHDEADEGSDDAQQQSPLVDGVGRAGVAAARPPWLSCPLLACTHGRHSSHVPYAAGAGT